MLQLNKVTKAIADAETCIRLKPEWEKGYFRKGNALETLEKTEEVSAGRQEGFSTLSLIFLQRKTADVAVRFLLGA